MNFYRFMQGKVFVMEYNKYRLFLTHTNMPFQLNKFALANFALVSFALVKLAYRCSFLTIEAS